MRAALTLSSLGLWLALAACDSPGETCPAPCLSTQECALASQCVAGCCSDRCESDADCGHCPAVTCGGPWCDLASHTCRCELGGDGGCGQDGDDGADGGDAGDGDGAGEADEGPADGGDGADGADAGSDGDHEAPECQLDTDCAAGRRCDQGSCADLPFLDMLLGAEGGTLVHADGRPFDFRGAISCCMGGYGWPLADQAWVDLLAEHEVRFLHFRLGPWLTGPGGESDWAARGGGYVEQGGLADLDRFNDTFWMTVAELIAYAGSQGMWVEIDLVDGWGLKHCRWGDTPGYSAWDPAWNLQGEDWCTTSGSAAIPAGSRPEAWVRQVVATTGAFGNVIYQDGNEIGIVGGYDPAWTLSLAALVRDEEARHHYARHLFGTNSGDAAAMQAAEVEYVELHQDTAADPAACHGKPCLVNEYNPDPPLTPAEFQAQLCAARAMGSYFWYWRHGQEQAAFLESLALMDEPCP